MKHCVQKYKFKLEKPELVSNDFGKYHFSKKNLIFIMRSKIILKLWKIDVPLKNTSWVSLNSRKMINCLQKFIICARREKEKHKIIRKER